MVEDEKGSRLEKWGKGPVYAFAGLAAAIWLYVIYHVKTSAAKTRFALASGDQINVEFDPDFKGGKVVYHWTWP